MQLWEYDVLEVRVDAAYPPAEWVEFLNRCGAVGWELVGLKEIEGRIYGFLKRPLE
jgi:hypothetical protein